ncbi:MAG: ribosomal protein S18-alanine N-acetyltransferase [Thermodesulfobacteriaceae bacterium]|nr:ribosomal protein S18-alanine N-acetyltransferase [Thermodesulfobacteriaceae bacterium]MCX8041950.1 ribosomal protein S18-alanine N-acetyltransferase [Thermodesulfobacteriaceae bacterium]MDW8136243.1 ribosomal protein S18-alanine N-acetyltransferase [Thermodesulfobacterium sp.]
MFEIRVACSEDLKKIYNLETFLFKEKAWSYASLGKEFKNSFSQIWILEKAREFLGYLIFRQILEEAEILRLGIRPEYQNQKLGTLFLKFFLNYCKERKIKKIYLEVEELNKAAFNLYQKLGFKESYRRKNYYKERTAIIMESKL